MSQENAPEQPGAMEVLRRWTDAFNEGDFETTLALTADDIEYHELEGVAWGERNGRRLQNADPARQRPVAQALSSPRLR
jgi:hypothetical protein